jgi:hypothetical protein
MNIEALTKQVAEASGKKFCSASDLEFFREKQREYVRVRGEADFHNPRQAGIDIVKHQNDIVEAAKAGQLRAIRAYSLEEMTTQYRQKANAGYEHCRRICQEVLPKAGEIASKFAKVADEFAADARAAAEKEHARFGVPYVPSALDGALSQVSVIALARVKPNQYQNTSPAQLLPYLDL